MEEGPEIPSEEHTQVDVARDAALAGAVAQREPLPWILFATTFAVFVVSTLLLISRLSSQSELSAQAINGLEAMEKEKKAAEAEATALRSKLGDLEARLKSAGDEKASLENKLKVAQERAEKERERANAAAKKVPVKKAAPKKRR